MTNVFVIIIFATIISSCNSNASKLNTNQVNTDTMIQNQDQLSAALGMDLIDAYKLTFGNTPLYGSYDSFINDLGIPPKVTVVKNGYDIKSKTDLDKAIATAKNPDIVTLHYPGIDMWFTYQNTIIPWTIDFRKSGKPVSYGKTTFDTTYTFEKFKSQFPNSANPSFALAQSMFEVAAKEKGPQYKHYLLMRKTKTDPDARPMVEFTFENDKLIFILFANF